MVLIVVPFSIDSILLSQSKTVNAEVVSFINLYTKNSTILTSGEQHKNMKKQ